MTKTATITVRVPATLKAAVEQAAQADQRTVADYVGRVLDAHLAAKPDTWRQVHDLLQDANDIAGQVDNGDAPDTRLVAAVWCLIRAVNVLNDAA